MTEQGEPFELSGLPKASCSLCNIFPKGQMGERNLKTVKPDMDAKNTNNWRL